MQKKARNKSDHPNPFKCQNRKTKILKWALLMVKFKDYKTPFTS